MWAYLLRGLFRPLFRLHLTPLPDYRAVRAIVTQPAVEKIAACYLDIYGESLVSRTHMA